MKIENKFYSILFYKQSGFHKNRLYDIDNAL